MDSNLKKFSSNLKSLMDSRNYTVKSLSEAINIPEATISRYRNCRRLPEITYVIALSSFFDVSVDWLLGINGDKFDVLPQDIQDVALKYSIASPNDKNIVKAVLDRYKVNED